MSTVTVFAWGAALGYLVGCVEYEVSAIRRAKREAAAKVAEARKRVDG